MRLSSGPNRFMASESGWSVTVVYSPEPRKIEQVSLALSEPCSVLRALQLSGLLANYPELDSQQILLGVWGRKATPNQLLRDQDRVEVYRPLRVDPKVARRERFVKQGSRSTGLFVKTRIGAKAGY